MRNHWSVAITIAQGNISVEVVVKVKNELCRGDDIGEMLLWQALGYTQPRHSGRTGGHEDLKLKPQMAMMVV